MQTTASPSTAAPQRNGRRPRLRRAFVAVAVATVTVGGAGLASQATATSAPKTITVKGTYDDPFFSGPSCSSPVGLCFKGEFKGSLKGANEGTIDSVTPTPQPGVVVGYSTTNTINDRHGDLHFGQCHVVINTSPGSAGELTILCEIAGGTGRYAGASGYIQGIGNAPPGTGENSGRYFGVINLQ